MRARLTQIFVSAAVAGALAISAADAGADPGDVKSASGVGSIESNESGLIQVTLPGEVFSGAGGRGG